MKISQRKKIVLSVLIILSLLFLYYHFVIQSQITRLNQAKEDNEIASDKLKSIDEDSEKKLETQFLKHKKITNNLAEEYFGDVEQEEIILLLTELCNKNGITITEVAFDENQDIVKLDFSETGKDQGNSANENSVVEKTALKKAKYEVLSTNLKFTSTYSSLTEFLSEIEKNSQKIIVSTLNIKNEDPDILSGEVTLDFYYAPFINDYLEAEKNPLADDFISKSKNTNPFEAYSGFYIMKIEEDGFLGGADTNKSIVELDRGQDYTVKYGDTLFDLSNHFYGNPFKVNLLVEENNIMNPDLINVGQELLIPKN